MAVARAPRREGVMPGAGAKAAADATTAAHATDLVSMVTVRISDREVALPMYIQRAASWMSVARTM